MSDIPNISNFENGVIKCGSCGAKFPFGDMEPLKIEKCPECGAPEFIPKKINAFWLYLPLGGGGMGSVYKAVGDDGQSLYAVKVLPREFKDDHELIDNLYKECECGAAFGTHPNIVAVVDYGQDDDEYFMVTEFIEGDRLDIRVEHKEELSEKRVIDIALQILEGLIHMAECGYLFRDLKPQNVIIENNGNVRLFDYGLCMTLDEAANPDAQSDKLEGSPHFIPPERIIGAPEGEFSEIYSLGMLIYYMLSGKNYYKEAETTVDLVKKHVVAARISSVAHRFKNCIPETTDMIDKMIKRTPAQRYQDYDELWEDMEKLPPLVEAAEAEAKRLADEEAKAASETRTYQLKDQKSGLKSLVVAASIFGSIVVAGGGIYYLFFMPDGSEKVPTPVSKTQNKAPAQAASDTGKQQEKSTATQNAVAKEETKKEESKTTEVKQTEAQKVEAAAAKTAEEKAVEAPKVVEVVETEEQKKARLAKEEADRKAKERAERLRKIREANERARQEAEREKKKKELAKKREKERKRQEAIARKKRALQRKKELAKKKAQKKTKTRKDIKANKVDFNMKGF